jgi:hypothetical protein
MTTNITITKHAEGGAGAQTPARKKLPGWL